MSGPASETLRRIPLTATDVPAGWRAVASTPDADDAANTAALVACAGGRNTTAHKLAKVDSPEFELGNASLQSSASALRSQDDVDADVAVLHSPKISACYTTLIKKELVRTLAGKATVGAVRVQIRTPGSGAPKNVVAVGVGSVALKVQSKSLTLNLAVAFVTGPRVEAEVDATNAGGAIDENTFEHAAEAVAARARTA